MKDVLEVYTRPYDPLRPQVCMDETSKQMLRETRAALPMAPGKSRREDYEYERGGVANVFMFIEPLTGRRWVNITEQRTKVDWAHQRSRSWWRSVTHWPSGSCWLWTT